MMRGGSDEIKVLWNAFENNKKAIENLKAPSVHFWDGP